MLIQHTGQFLKSHDFLVRILEQELKTKNKNSNVLEFNTDPNLESRIWPPDLIKIVQFCLTMGNCPHPKTLRVLGITTGIGDSVPSHDHGEEHTALYYLQGTSPLTVDHSSINIRPGVVAYLEPGIKHEVPTETSVRHCIGVLWTKE